MSQLDMFTGEIVDTRTRKQKRNAKRKKFAQPSLFPRGQYIQFGEDADPQLSISPHTRLELQIEDPRTEEEKAAEERRINEELHIGRIA